MAMNVKGTVIQKCGLQTGESKSGKSWQKREFVIETSEEQYPKQIAFTCFGDKVSMIDTISEGQTVDVYFNLESRPYNDKFFHNINAWKIEAGAATTRQAPSTGLTSLPKETAMPTQTSEADENDLPF